MKSIPDQIIESVCDGDIVKELLQENNLTFATGIANCHSKEATKKHSLDTADPGPEIVAAIHQLHQPAHHTLVAISGYRSVMHVGGHR